MRQPPSSPSESGPTISDPVVDPVPPPELPADPLAAQEPIRFFLPGPAYVTEAARRTMLGPVMAHRSPGFKAIYGRLTRGLQEVFGTSRDTPLATGSATLVMEIAIASTVGSRVLHLVNGSFSERWQAIARALGRQADRLEFAWGRPVDPETLRQALRRASYEAVTVVQSETSTGVLNPVEEIARVVREESDALVLVDAVSSLGGAPLDADAWGLDLVLTGSQKALAGPPGLVPFTASERAEERAAGVPTRGFYTDLLRYLRYHRDGGTITTPALPVAYALDHQLAVIAAEGLEERWRRHARMAERVERWAADRQVRFASAAGFRSPTVSCLEPPPGIAAPRVVAALAAKGYTVASGYGAWKPTTFRIGHMGQVRERDLEELLEVLDETLEELAP